MPNMQLLDYINQAREKGMTDVQIRQELSAIGWSQSEIDEHLGLQVADNNNSRGDTKKCLRCQMDIPSLADVCPYCQSKILKIPKPEKIRPKHDTLKLILTAVTIIIAPLFIFMGLLFGKNTETTPTSSTPAPTVGTLTYKKVPIADLMAEGNRLTPDATADEAVEVEGTVIQILPEAFIILRDDAGNFALISASQTDEKDMDAIDDGDRISTHALFSKNIKNSGFDNYFPDEIKLPPETPWLISTNDNGFTILSKSTTPRPSNWYPVLSYSLPPAKENSFSVKTPGLTPVFNIKSDRWRIKWAMTNQDSSEYATKGDIEVYLDAYNSATKSFVSFGEAMPRIDVEPSEIKNGVVNKYGTGTYRIEFPFVSSLVGVNLVIEELADKPLQTSQTFPPPPKPLPLGSLPSDLHEYAYSVVKLTCPNEDKTQTILGSGVVIDNRGFILTNNHLTPELNARNCDVWLTTPGQDNKFISGLAYSAVLVSSLTDYDVSVFRVVKDVYGNNINSVAGLRPLEMSDEAPWIGRKIIVIGYPSTVNNEFHITTGQVTWLPIIKGHEVIQTDATISPGNSGGALLDYQGHFLGIPNARFKDIDGGYAIKVSRIKQWAQSVIQKTSNLSAEQIMSRTADTTVNPF